MTSRLMYSILMVFISCLFLPCDVYSEEGNKEVAYREKLKVMVKMKANWEHDWPQGKHWGDYSVTIQGDLEIDDKWSSQNEIGKPVLAAYRIGNLMVSYNYSDFELDKDPPEDCKGPDASIVRKVKGYDTTSLPPMPGGAPVLQVNYMKSQLDNAMEGLTGLDAKMAAGFFSQLGTFKDFYIFTLPAAKVKIQGISRNTDCSHRNIERTISALPLTLTLQLSDDGTMADSRNWDSTFSASPSLNIRIRELPDSMGKADNFIKPQHEGLPGSVHYSLSWTIGPPGPVQMQRKINNKWADLSTNETYRKVLVGEKIELRAISLPNKKVVGKSYWKIDDNPNPEDRNFLKKFIGSSTTGKVIHLNHNDFRNSRLKFHWYRGKGGTVECQATLNGQQYTLYETFSIVEPDYKVTYISRDGSTFGPTHQHLLEDDSLIKDFPMKQLVEQGKTGLQYNGIRFEANNLSGEFPGDTQWVQLAKQRQWGINDTGAAVKIKKIEGLDSGHYPTYTGPVFVDAPGIVVDNISDTGRMVSCMDIDFRTFVMYRPKGRYGEPDKRHMWVPINKITWGWKGCVQKSGNTWQKSHASEPVGGPGEKPEPEVTATTEYPTWSGHTR